MLLSLIAAAAITSPAALPAATEDHGKIAWFEGTYEAALEQAAAEDRIIFIDFWTDWCVWCKRLDADVFSQESVATAMSDIVCLSIDAESKTGAPIAKRFNVKGFPTLLLLNSDGTVRDLISGYMPPEEFIAEIERIEADEGTISGLRRDVAANPKNLEARYALAMKLDSVGDEPGYEEQLAAIRELDPEGKSIAMRTLKSNELMDAVRAKAGAGKMADLDDLLAFLDTETEASILFEGYYLAWTIEEFHVRLTTAEESELAVIDGHRAAELAMARKAWQHVPEEFLPTFGNQVAWHAWELREELPADYKVFALEIIRKSAEVSVDNVNILDTLACVLFMNGDREGALEQARRCIELDPDNEVFSKRLAEFGAES